MTDLEIKARLDALQGAINMAGECGHMEDETALSFAVLMWNNALADIRNELEEARAAIARAQPLVKLAGILLADCDAMVDLFKRAKGSPDADAIGRVLELIEAHALQAPQDAEQAEDEWLDLLDRVATLEAAIARAKAVPEATYETAIFPESWNAGRDEVLAALESPDAS